MRTSETGLALGIDVGGTNTVIGLVDGQGQIEAKTRIRSVIEETPRDLVDRIVAVAVKLSAFKNLTQVGVGIAGLIDHRKGVVRFSPNLLSWKNVPLKDMLQDKLGVPAAVGNDANAIAWGEFKFGGYDSDDLFCFTLGTGVGGGIISGGRLILGGNDASAEFGHTSFERSGPRCSCGLSGCLEAYVGSSRLVCLAKRRMGLASALIKLSSTREVTPKLIAEAAREGDEVAVDIFREAGERIGRALGNVVQLLDPEVIVINGGISNAGNILLDPIRKTLKCYTMPLENRKLRVVRSKLGDKAGILGAAILPQAYV